MFFYKKICLKESANIVTPHITQCLPFSFLPGPVAYVYYLYPHHNHQGSPYPGGESWVFLLGGYVPPGTTNWHPVLKKNSPKIDTPF